MFTSSGYNKNVPMTGKASYSRTRPRGSSTKATYKQRMAEIQSAMGPVTQKVEGPLTKLLGDQTSGFVLKSMNATAGDIAGDAYNIEIETAEGVTLYIKAGTAQA